MRSVFVPRVVDVANLNPQVNNVREILARWDVPGWRVRTLAYGEPDRRVAGNPQVDITRLWRWRFWPWHHWLCYFKPCDLVFYPGVHWSDFAGLRWRRRFGMRAPVVVTLEGLLGDAERERYYSRQAGHPVFCQPVAAKQLAAVDALNQAADHLIAISPFLERMGKGRFGDKLLMLPLGINLAHYHAEGRIANRRLKIVSAGGVRAHKRPQVLLELAARHPHCDFVWYGEGELRAPLQQQAAQRGLGNVSFPGALAPPQLGDALRAADIFVMPSYSEGVPKVTQEAAACGLAQVVYGYYEPPSVIDGVNGFITWNDEQWLAKVAELIDDHGLVSRFGQAGAAMAHDWDWNRVAAQWREALVKIADGGKHQPGRSDN